MTNLWDVVRSRFHQIRKFYDLYLVSVVICMVVLANHPINSYVSEPDLLAGVAGPMIVACVALMILSKVGKFQLQDIAIALSSIAGAWMWMADVLNTSPISLKLVQVVSLALGIAVLLPFVTLVWISVYVWPRVSKHLRR